LFFNPVASTALPQLNLPGEFVSEFTLIWDLFDGQYVGFAVKDVNWDSICSQYRSQAEDVSSRDSLGSGAKSAVLST
jgi:hypothetical protein